MCNTITIPSKKIIYTISEMIDFDWYPTADDIDPLYSNVTIDTLQDNLDSCLCLVDVEKILNRYNVKYTTDVYGWNVAE